MCEYIKHAFSVHSGSLIERAYCMMFKIEGGRKGACRRNAKTFIYFVKVVTQRAR